MIEEWFGSYGASDRESAHAAYREILQEIALAGLHRSGFFENAAFYGGTALRILHGLDRFSEDLDFTLMRSEPAFSLGSHLAAVVSECEGSGLRVTARIKQKKTGTPIETAFLKSETSWSELSISERIPHSGSIITPAVKIKIEVDRHPPLGFHTEERLLSRPYPFTIKCLTLPDLFAGKMHAILHRKWGSRVKGRDWYDMEWYVRKGVPLHLHHLCQRSIQSGDWMGDELTAAELKGLMLRKVSDVSFDSIRADLGPFLRDPSVMDHWSAEYFSELVLRIQYV